MWQVRSKKYPYNGTTRLTPEAINGAVFDIVNTILEVRSGCEAKFPCDFINHEIDYANPTGFTILLAFRPDDVPTDLSIYAFLRESMGLGLNTRTIPRVGCIGYCVLSGDDFDNPSDFAVSMVMRGFFNFDLYAVRLGFDKCQ